MAKNGVRSGPKKAKSGGFRVDFTVKNGRVHGGERGYAQIPHPIPHSSTQFHTVLHPVTPFRPDLPCLNVNSKIPLCRPKSQDPYSGVLLYTVLYGKIPRPLQRGICYCAVFVVDDLRCVVVVVLQHVCIMVINLCVSNK
jgi:hypothetical protein